jgi:hypothetical protein
MWFGLKPRHARNGPVVDFAVDDKSRPILPDDDTVADAPDHSGLDCQSAIFALSAGIAAAALR